jgi:dUTP pyrophosphatase
VFNAPGTVDAGYRGEITVILSNTDRILSNTDRTEPIRLPRGDRIAQLVVRRAQHAVFRDVDAPPAAGRGVGGLGSTDGFGGARVDAAQAGVRTGVQAGEGNHGVPARS